MVEESAGETKQSREHETKSDHVFASGICQKLSDLSEDFSEYWPELSEALRTAGTQINTLPRDLRVTTTRPRPDPHSLKFGDSLHRLKSETQKFLQTAARLGSKDARTEHKQNLLTAWQDCMESVEDKDAANEVSRHQTSALVKGRQVLRNTTFDVAKAIDNG